MNAYAKRRIGFFVTRRVPWPPSTSGSYHTLESIGSSVNDTNSDTSTANATLTPNWKKMRPIIPPMNATGMNTAITAIVVENTARPISLVPSLAAWWCSFPISMWRTMFSRTTIASSIRSPIASDNASSVIVFSVKPNRNMPKNAEMTEIGSARPVMTVERQELRNR